MFFPARPDFAAALPASDAKACRACGLLQDIGPPEPGRDRKCARCDESLGSGLVHLDLLFPALLAALVAFLAVVSQPLVRIELQGRRAAGDMATAVAGFWHYDMQPLAFFTFACIIFAPLGRVITLLLVAGCLLGDRRPPWLARLYRFSETLRPWCMLDVFLVATLISMTKLRDLVDVDMAPGLWLLMGLVWCLALADSLFDRHRLWDFIAPAERLPEGVPPERILSCVHCGQLHDLAGEPAGAVRCGRCMARLHRRKPDSVQLTGALVLSGMILYIPANLYPVFTIVSFGRSNTSTILGGVRQLLNGSDWPLAVIIFVASIVVPLIKLIGLAWLLVCIRWPSRRLLRANTRLHRLIEVIGRWSATDVFVAAVLSGLVLFDNLATIVPGRGVLAFSAVVVLTMVATMTFDQRLLWDRAEEQHD